ncbi:MAG: hypothetical protein LC122_11905 [Chitinophagales bacterium]|nr:hypothetical protein [Chitinophagales bacterium]
MKYNLGDIVKFLHNNEKFVGEIVGISKTSEGYLYCIFNDKDSNNFSALKMEEYDVMNFILYSKKFSDNIGKKAFWKSESSVVGFFLDGCYCENCREFSRFSEPNVDGKFICYLCRQNRWR